MTAAAAWAHSLAAQTDNDPLRLLRAGHPRLLLLDSDLDRLRQTTKDNPLAKRLFGDLEKEADHLLSIPPVEYKLTGQRLQTQTRRAVDRVTTLALMYRLTGRDPWLRRAIMELNAAASFRDWNPAHFVETAEMTHAFAIGYDWLYNALSAEERLWIRENLVTKGLDPALPFYQQKTWWTREHYNWNIVCNGGMTLGALAVAEDESAKSGEILRGALESIPHGLTTFGTDGGWPEGPSYAEFVGRYASLFFCALDTALGNDYGLSGFHGLDRAGRFRIYTTGPTNKSFNFADALEDPGTAPEMFWMAKHFAVPAYAWCEQRQLERSTHPDPLDLAWFDRDAKPPLPPAFALDSVFHGVGVASFRTSWDDPNALFLAVKGGDNKSPHAHLDLGSFVLDAGGVRWAADLGPDDANTPAPLRGGVYRVRTEAHNTLLIEGENQDPKAEARITRQELAPDFSWVQIDLSKASPRVKQWTRRIGIAQRQAVLIEDSLRTDPPVDVIWSMTTDADISVNGPTATLHRNGWNLAAEIRTPRHAVFDIAPV
ncbi:MAG: heparinase II/III-family protein, partial [Acidobacteriota bacterium]|nr:heparinase II/III-family protein [Acidobacteriota bacterium]